METFKAKIRGTAVTKEIKHHDFTWKDKNYRVIDTPGLKDIKMPLSKWIEIYNEGATKMNEPKAGSNFVNLALVVIKA